MRSRTHAKVDIAHFSTEKGGRQQLGIGIPLPWQAFGLCMYPGGADILRCFQNANFHRQYGRKANIPVKAATARGLRWTPVSGCPLPATL